jgi:cysteine-S-conjugate beta-lyase
MNIKEFCEKYYVDRQGSNSLKWDALDKRFGDKDLIAMWVADMEFKAPEAVIEAMKERIEHGVFGKKMNIIMKLIRSGYVFQLVL